MEAALRRIEAGALGDCEGCDEPIDLRWLEARPEAPLCLGCQASRER